MDLTAISYRLPALTPRYSPTGRAAVGQRETTIALRRALLTRMALGLGCGPEAVTAERLVGWIVVTARTDRLPAAIMHTDKLTAVLQDYGGALHVEGAFLAPPIYRGPAVPVLGRHVAPRGPRRDHARRHPVRRRHR
jgi:hypothetical protein